MKSIYKQRGFLGGIISSILPAVVSGGLSLFGGKKQNEANFQSAQDARHFNEQEAAISREFTREQNEADKAFNSAEGLKQREFAATMSNTAHQRQVADLRRAGLNPILSAKYGGSSSPPGVGASAKSSTAGAATSPTARAENVLGQAASSALQTYRFQNEVARIKADTANAKLQPDVIKANVKNINEDTVMKNAKANEAQASAGLKHQENITSGHRARNLEAQTASAKEALTHMRTKLEALREHEKIDKSEYGKILMWINRIAAPGNSAKRLIHRGAKR